jgi:2-polyprenyl-6-hydroxyphenyl methylase / 3-demethylubiquinone-9 3-methyltransferase
MSTSSNTGSNTGTIDPREAAHFGRMAADWWDPKGSSAMLHRLNPPRLAYLRAAVDAHWGGDPTGFAPLAGRTALDVGCGAGLVCEPLARLGAEVTGVDAAAENVEVARVHAAAGGLRIDYRAGSVENLEARFDLVTCFEVIEHASDQPGFVRGLARAVAPGGLLVMSTPNRTAVSRAALVGAAEATGMIPRGTHDWHRFLTPDELTAMLADAGLRVTDVTGLSLTARGFATGGSTALDYLVTAVRA